MIALLLLFVHCCKGVFSRVKNLDLLLQGDYDETNDRFVAMEEIAPAKGKYEAANLTHVVDLALSEGKQAACALLVRPSVVGRSIEGLECSRRSVRRV